MYCTVRKFCCYLHAAVAEQEMRPCSESTGDEQEMSSTGITKRFVVVIIGGVEILLYQKYFENSDQVFKVYTDVIISMIYFLWKSFTQVIIDIPQGGKAKM